MPFVMHLIILEMVTDIIWIQLQSWILYGYNEIELGKYIEYSNKLIDESSDTEPDLHDTDED